MAVTSRWQRLFRVSGRTARRARGARAVYVPGLFAAGTFATQPGPSLSRSPTNATRNSSWKLRTRVKLSRFCETQPALS